MNRFALQDLTLGAAAVLALALQLALGESAFLPAILALTAILGMPHGALDLALVRHLWPIRSTGRLVLFLSLYLGLAAVVVAFWMANPTVALAGFLGYSAWHFSDDWRALSGQGGSLAGGALVLALPALAEPERTAALFSALGADGASVQQALGTAGIAAVVLFVRRALGRPRPLLRMAFLAVCAVALAPLAYFFVFFCGLHAVRHKQEVSHVLDLDWWDSARRMLWPTLGTLATLAVAGLILVRRDMPPDAMLMQVVFVAFAALTVPHMLLVDRFERMRE